MPAHRNTAKKNARVSGATQQPHRVQPNADKIVTRRTYLMSELTRLREVRGSPRTLENVQQLLTRWWSPANWRAREELLKTAEWFLQLECTAREKNAESEKLARVGAERTRS